MGKHWRAQKRRGKGGCVQFCFFSLARTQPCSSSRVTDLKGGRGGKLYEIQKQVGRQRIFWARGGGEDFGGRRQSLPCGEKRTFLYYKSAFFAITATRNEQLFFATYDARYGFRFFSALGFKSTEMHEEYTHGKRQSIATKFGEGGLGFGCSGGVGITESR